jgi:hypothetical protein
MDPTLSLPNYISSAPFGEKRQRVDIEEPIPFFDNLPIEMMRKIFRDLLPKDLCHMSLVGSRRIRQIAIEVMKTNCVGLLQNLTKEIKEQGPLFTAEIVLDSWEKDTCADIHMASTFSQVIRTYDEATIILRQYLDAKTKVKSAAGECTIL